MFEIQIVPLFGDTWRTKGSKSGEGDVPLLAEFSQFFLLEVDMTLYLKITDRVPGNSPNAINLL